MKRALLQRLHLSAAMMLVALFTAPYVSAAGPTINAKVYDGRPTVLTIASPQDNATVTVSPVSISGTIRNVSQIMVYVDDAYSMTQPIDVGATTYTFEASVSPGTHTLKLVAINPFDSTTLEGQVTITYAPGEKPVAAEAVKNVTESAEVTKEYLQDQVQQAAQTQPAVGLSGAVYSAMQALDLAPVAGSTELMHQMTQRFVGVVGGASLVLFAHPIFVGYHLLRYQFMQWNLPAMPALVRRHALLVLRALGGALFFGAFFI